MRRAFTTYFRVPDPDALGVADIPIPFLPGGPHLSLPSFRRRKVTHGDSVFLIGVRQGTLFRVARIDVEAALTLDEFMEKYDERPEDRPGFRDDLSYGASLRTWPKWNFLFSTCTEEILVAADSTPLSDAHPVPTEMLAQLEYTGREGRRKVVKTLHDGKVSHISSLQGIFELTEESALLLRSL